MPKVVNIIQARMKSVRFPGKMMANLQGRPVMDWVLERCLQANSVSETFLATSNLPEDDVLVERAEALGVSVFRGDEQNVLSRYVSVAKETKADIVIRVCGDRPLIDSALIDMAVQYLVDHPNVDLAYNHISGDDQNWPRGFGVEVFWARHLVEMGKLNDVYCQEHVTPYLWDSSQDFLIQAIPCPTELDYGIPDIECDLDTEEDLKLIQSMCKHLNIESSALDLFNAWKLLAKKTVCQ